MIPTTQTIASVHRPDATERATIRTNLREHAHNQADFELLCAAMGVTR